MKAPRQVKLKVNKKALSLFVLASLVSASSAKAQQQPFHYVAAYQQAQEKRLEADKRLALIMEDACDYMLSFRNKYGHFPELGVEQDRSVKQLHHAILKSNPYSTTGIQSQDERSKPCPLKFVTEPNLSEQQRKQWEQNPPPHWRAEPGTLTVITDMDKNIFIWGAGSDHLPIRDYKTNKVTFAWRELE